MRFDPLAPKKKSVVFRVAEPLRSYALDRAKEEGVNISDVFRAATELHRDLHELLGADWYEAKKRAGISKQSLGAVLAALIRAGLQAERRNNNHNR